MCLALSSRASEKKALGHRTGIQFLVCAGHRWNLPAGFAAALIRVRLKAGKMLH